MEQRNVEKINVLIQRWGVPLQLIISMEEMADLVHVCSKLLRGDVPRPVLVDAMADAYVMLQTMSMIFDVRGEELEAVISQKLDKGLAVPLPQAQAPQAAPATAPVPKAQPVQAPPSAPVTPQDNITVQKAAPPPAETPAS